MPCGTYGTQSDNLGEFCGDFLAEGDNVRVQQVWQLGIGRKEVLEKFLVEFTFDLGEDASDGVLVG